MADHHNAKDAVTAWLNESEGFSLRIERLHEDAASGNDLVPWLVEAFRLGADRAAPEGQVRAVALLQRIIDGREVWRGDHTEIETLPADEIEKLVADAIAALTPPPAAPEGPKIEAIFETVDVNVPVTGQTQAPIKRIEHQDDGSFTVVIDHWPPPPAAPTDNTALVEALEIVKEHSDDGAMRSLAKRTLDKHRAALSGREAQPACQQEAVTDLAAARAENERLTKERDEALALLADAYGAGTGGSVIESHLADAERDMRQRAAASIEGNEPERIALRKAILALPLKHADREGGK